MIANNLYDINLNKSQKRAVTVLKDPVRRRAIANEEPAWPGPVWSLNLKAFKRAYNKH